ncbi:MAG: hypothetical protein Q9163_006253 [Psora crenata]
MAPTADYDVLMNQINVGLARSQRVIASWLPPEDPNQTSSRKSEAETGEEEEGDFVAEPEILGVGAKPAEEDGRAQREEMSSNDRLRKELLTKDSGRKRKRDDDETKKASLQSSKPRPRLQHRKAEDESEEEEGRSGLGKSRRRQDPEAGNPSRAGEVGQVTPAETIADESATGKRRNAVGKNYLDEVLAGKHLKKKRKKTKNTQGAQAK